MSTQAMIAVGRDCVVGSLKRARSARVYSRAKKRTTWLSFCGVVLWCILATRSGATTAVNDGEQDVLPQPCATDPAYREFEKIQADAYLSDRHFPLLLSPDFQDRVRRDAMGELRRRSGVRSGKLSLPSGFDREIQKEMARTTTPTCYENPLTYYLIAHYARDVETARRELGMPLSEPPRFGSIPSNDINAHTYPVSSGKGGGIIAINTQLFNFIDRMTELAAFTVDPGFDEGKDSDAKIITQALLNISYNEPAKDRFISSIVGLLYGKPLGSRPFGSPEETLVVFFTGAMKRFVLAHEYGHLIKGHLSPKMSLPTGTTGSSEHEVLVRTWQQEFEADAIGLELLIKVLLGSAAENQESEQYFIYALKAPVFFFECLELLERAKWMQGNRVLPPPLTDDLKSLARSCADAATPASDSSRCAPYALAGHPPAWLRRERLERLLNDKLAHIAMNKETAAALRKADELVFSIDWFWHETSPQVLKQIIEQSNKE